MNIKNALNKFPTKRIKPVDGMSITADVWEEAHDYPREQQQMHALLGHGPGILAGLEVTASNPADTAVYVRPGAAIGPNGQTIVLAEPIRYDLGQAIQGTLHVLIDYGESRPRAARQRSVGDSLLYIDDQYQIEAQLTLPADNYVELARIRRDSRGALIRDAVDSEHPGFNEIDMRFRQTATSWRQQPVGLAVSYVGEMTDTQHGKGVSYLARFLRRSGAFSQTPVWVDNHAPLDEEITNYTLLCLVGQNAFQLSQAEITVLYNYIQGGGTLLFESCRRNLNSGQAPADSSFFNLVQSLGYKVADLSSGHSLLTEPFLFAAPPPGFETQGKIQIGEGIIFSSFDYGCLWQAEQRTQVPSRDTIRAALEWGGNLVHYALTRRSKYASARK